MGIRTPDLLIANETLYQLSYTPKSRSLKKSGECFCGKSPNGRYYALAKARSKQIKRSLGTDNL